MFSRDSWNSFHWFQLFFILVVLCMLGFAVYFDNNRKKDEELVSIMRSLDNKEDHIIVQYNTDNVTGLLGRYGYTVEFVDKNTVVYKLEKK